MATTQHIDLGRPNNADDGPGLTLDAALNASLAGIAYTRLEASPNDPYRPQAQARVIAVEHKPSGEWNVWEFKLAQQGWQGWPMTDFRDAEAYCAYRLDVPRGPVWYSAFAPLEVEHEDGLVRGMF